VPFAALDSQDRDDVRDTDLVPIPGGLAPSVHYLRPRASFSRAPGLDVELNGITNFRGFSALGYLAGTLAPICVSFRVNMFLPMVPTIAVARAMVATGGGGVLRALGWG
jgi:hypothetical protein